MAVEIQFDVQKSLLELEPENWDVANLDEQQLAIAQRCAAKPLRRLGLTELYLLLRENLALPYVAPLAIQRLEGEPFLEAATHRGDLLTALMESDSRFWMEHYALWLDVIPLLEAAVVQIQEHLQREAEEEGEVYLPWHVGDDFMGALLHFRGIHNATTATD